MVAQDQRRLVAEVADQSRALVEIEGDALVVVVADPIVEHRRMLVDVQQAFLQAGDGDAGAGMRVQDAVDLRPRHVHGAVDDEAGVVHGITGVLDDVALVVDLDQARRGDLVEHHPIGIDEEMLGLARHPRRDVREDEIVHAEMGDEAIARGERDAHLALVGLARFGPVGKSGDTRHGRPRGLSDRRY